MIFEFSSYRDYLKYHLYQLPHRGHGEARKIANHLRVSSTFISQVFSGVKTLTPEQAQSLVEYLGLNHLEADYFFYLVQLDRAGSYSLKKYLQKKLFAIKKKSLNLSHRLKKEKALSEIDKSIFYSRTLYSATHIFCSTAEKGKTIDEIAKRLNITRMKAKSTVQFLCSAGLLSENNNFYKVTPQSTHLGKASPHLVKHHINWRLNAIQQAEDLKDQELMYTANVSLSEKDFNKLREKMVQFISQFLETVHASPAEDIANFNLDFFWIKKL